MAKDPILPLYYNDLTTSTQDWTDEEFGAYVRLLIHQWRQGGLPKDYQRLTRIATSLDSTWTLLKSKFQEVDGLLKNPVMEEIRDKRSRHKQKQKDNVSKRYQNVTKQATKNLPLEIENEIENEELIINNDFIEKIDVEDKLRALDDIYLDQQRIKWQHINFDFEVNAFREKVRGSPNHYASHDSGGIRLAFQSQLRNAKSKQNGLGKKADEIISRREAFARRHGSGAGS